MNKCCLDLVKFILFLVNFKALVWVGCGLAVCIYVLVESERLLGFIIHPNFHPDNSTAIYFSLLLILIVLFAFLVIFTFLGCCGSACQNRCMLGSHVIILFVFLGANIGAIIYLFAFYGVSYGSPKDLQNGEIEMFTEELRRSIKYYRADDPPSSLSKKFWDEMQPALRCCGAESYKDWENAGHLKTGHKVPASCCDTERGSSPTGECTYNPGNGAYTVGCMTKLALPLRIAFWSIPSTMLLCLILSLMVCSAGDRTQYDDDRNTYHSANERHRRKTGPSREDHHEGTGYVYQPSPGLHGYPSAPPYNPEYPQPEEYGGGHRTHMDHYPTGVIPPGTEHTYRQPLIHPPPYHDVVGGHPR